MIVSQATAVMWGIVSLGIRVIEEIVLHSTSSVSKLPCSQTDGYFFDQSRGMLLALKLHLLGFVCLAKYRMGSDERATTIHKKCLFMN